MPTPKELSDRYIRAHNERDRVAMRALLLPVLEFVRPGGGKLTTAEEVMAQYERDWAVLTSSSVEVRELFESADGIIAEVTLRATMKERSLSIEAVVAHRWRGGRLIRYRVYSDLWPADLAAPTPRWSWTSLTGWRSTAAPQPNPGGACKDSPFAGAGRRGCGRVLGVPRGGRWPWQSVHPGRALHHPGKVTGKLLTLDRALEPALPAFRSQDAETCFGLLCSEVCHEITPLARLAGVSSL